ncbi:MAG: hypothetical protein OK457_05900, partial [Thaumarchaeota archaeon]|nr:hypothetical protein [Nitrososphaerota archaeon]
MTSINVRRSGLVSFAVRLSSTITGLVFVVLVTSNLSTADFGLWQLISKTVGYVIFPVVILTFWTTRYRARGTKLGKTVFVASLLFSVVLTFVYLLVSLAVVGSVTPRAGPTSNLFFFLISTPQIALYLVALTLEGILWGSRPEGASVGFGVFEISKVFLGWFTVGVLRLSLTGAILTIILAQVCQIITVLVLTRGEYSDKVSFSMISTMLKTGWVAVLNNLQPLVVTFDFLIVAIISGSTIPLAFYGAAYTLAGVITYSGFLSTGLYAGILSGRDPNTHTAQVLELQYLFIFPMVIGEIILARPLLNLLNPSYTSGVPILIILSIGAALLSIGQTFDSVILGTDTTDAQKESNFSIFLKSKMFLLSKINLGISIGYLASVALISEFVAPGRAQGFGLSWFTLLGVGWAAAYLGMGVFGISLKVGYVRKVARITMPPQTLLALFVGSIAFVAVLYPVSRIIIPKGGELLQAGYLLL